MKTLPTDGSAEKKIKIFGSCFMGLSHLLFLRDYLKGILFALIEIGFIALLPVTIKKMIDLVTLGTPSKPGVPITQRDNSVFMLIDGILFIAIIAVFVILYVFSVKSAKKEYREYCRKGHFNSNKENVNTTLGKSFPIFGMAPGFLIMLIFVVVPLIFSVAVAFTNYSAPDHIPAANTVDWVGFQNFKELLVGGTSWTKGFGKIAIWTLAWAVLSTFTCYFGGLLVAIQLRDIHVKIAPIFRFIFILPYAVPSVVSMLVWKNLLNGTFGVINRTFRVLGFLAPDATIPWLGTPLLAQIVCVIVNLWAGFGYFMLLSMGTMTAIPQDLYEAATIDGASKFQITRKITMPLVLYQTIPLIIMSFAHNINNFGAIYFLTGGSPNFTEPGLSTVTSAGATDILVTWIYKLTVDLQKYGYASVIAVMIFIVLAPFAIWQFRQTKAYKEGEI